MMRSVPVPAACPCVLFRTVRTGKGEEDDEAVEEDPEDLLFHVRPAVGPLLVLVPATGRATPPAEFHCKRNESARL